jgi:hypothetical protein
MDLNKKIDMYLKEDFDISNDPTLGNIDAMSFSTGLRRVNLLLLKANTPRKYAIAFEIANDMVQKFPLKSKLIIQAIVDAYNQRFGGA